MIGLERGIRGTERPSHRELNRKLAAATRLLGAECWAPANPSKLATDFGGLDLFLPEEQVAALKAVLAELKSGDYVGARPPERFYESATPAAELFAFGWRSEHFGRSMYFEFAICGSGSRQLLFVYSLHPARRRVKRP